MAIEIRAVILGSAINNDGAAKMGYSAPSVEGQAAAISAAMNWRMWIRERSPTWKLTERARR